jgi:hypothetical protein
LGPRRLKLYDLLTDRKLCSGDEISITTPEPDRLPLPNQWIFEMQWTLQQVAALKGVVEALDDDDDDDDGGWCWERSQSGFHPLPPVTALDSM